MSTIGIRTNSPLRRRLGDAGYEFLKHATECIERLLPHVEVSDWRVVPRESPSSVWTSAKKTHIRITLTIGPEEDDDSRSLQATVQRRQLGRVSRVLDSREHNICTQIALRCSEVLARFPEGAGGSSILAIQDAFDEHIVASHVQHHHELGTFVDQLFRALHTLSEQSYENKALTFGCVLDPAKAVLPHGAEFPADFLKSKKYKALSDGYRTAYVVSGAGAVLNFVDLEASGYRSLTEKHYFPDWTEPLARFSRKGRCGLLLSRQGDILVFDEGTLRLTYRYGHWQYWNHVHLGKV